MPIQFDDQLAKFTGHCAVEEAEMLLQWLQDHPQGCLDLQQCTHLHTAILQVMLATMVPIAQFPEDAHFKQLLQQILLAAH